MMKESPNSIKKFTKGLINKTKTLNTKKVFGIGFNKTGTTSLKNAMADLGYIVGDEYVAKKLFSDWVKRDFNSIIRYCKSANFFQDSPFSLPFTYIALDQAFPNSKFILTIRDSDEQWYNSLVSFHSKKWSDGTTAPTLEELKQSYTYDIKGRAYQTLKSVYAVNDDNLYDKEILMRTYRDHIEQVKMYFRHRPSDLLILNVSEKKSYHELCRFLNKPILLDEFPWVNRTSEV